MMKEWMLDGPTVRRPQHGSASPNALLDEQTVYEMREAHFDHGWSQRKLALRFGVADSTATQAILGYRWKHVAMEKRWQEIIEKRRDRIGVRRKR